MKCVFCELPEIKKRAIAENELAFAFLTNIPITPGHILVSPKRCVANFFDMTEKEKKAVLKLAGEMRTALAKTFGAEGFNFAWIVVAVISFALYLSKVQRKRRKKKSVKEHRKIYSFRTLFFCVF